MQIGQGQAPGKIAEPVPIEEAGSVKQALYQPLIEARLAELSGVPVTNVVSPPPKVKDPDEPTAVDKQAFLRAVLGDKSYEKVYSLFNGGLEVTLVDRSSKETEKLYEALRQQSEAEKLSDDDWDMWKTRYCLASTLRKVRFKGSTVKEYDVPVDLKGRSLEILEFSKAVYLALVATSKIFEHQVQLLTEKAHDADFWVTDGKGSR
jgi:hypothetical protein